MHRDFAGLQVGVGTVAAGRRRLRPRRCAASRRAAARPSPSPPPMPPGARSAGRRSPRRRGPPARARASAFPASARPGRAPRLEPRDRRAERRRPARPRRRRSWPAARRPRAHRGASPGSPGLHRVELLQPRVQIVGRGLSSGWASALGPRLGRRAARAARSPKECPPSLEFFQQATTGPVEAEVEDRRAARRGRPPPRAGRGRPSRPASAPPDRPGRASGTRSRTPRDRRPGRRSPARGSRSATASSGISGPAAARRPAARRWLASTLRATPSSHGSASAGTVVEPPPGDQEGLGDGIFGGGPIVGATDRVTQHPRIGGAEDPFELPCAARLRPRLSCRH